jgi:16S rRNA (cytidine1402-2'-O)-methyltransferase
MNKGTLYLLPSLLGETKPETVIPVQNLDIIRSTKYYIVEEIRTARRFLKKACPEINIDGLTFLVNNEHSSSIDLDMCIEPLLKGLDTGLLSEAGTPCVADPGAAIVRLAHHHQIRVVPLTGPSSLLLALMASGFNGQNFVFHGYLPIDKNQRQKKLKEIERSIYTFDQTQIFIETPYRNIQMFETILGVCSGSTLLCLAADLTTNIEKIVVLPVKDWKGKKPDIHKKPVVFLLYK